MRSVIRSALQAAVVIVLVIGVHGAEIAVAVSADWDEHVCGCVDGCACRVEHRDCHSPRASVKPSCGCGCGGLIHSALGSSLRTVLADDCRIGAPILIWTPTSGACEFPEWQLVFEHPHPPRSSL